MIESDIRLMFDRQYIYMALGQFAVGQFAVGTVRRKKRKKSVTEPNLT